MLRRVAGPSFLHVVWSVDAAPEADRGKAMVLVEESALVQLERDVARLLTLQCHQCGGATDMIGTGGGR
jgi:hypothetical protein